MSWRYGATAYEGMLAWHNVGSGPEERKQLARKLFAMERDALREAIASGPRFSSLRDPETKTIVLILKSTFPQA